MTSSLEAFRFIHASSLLLDHQLCDTGPLSEEIRHIVVDATLRALDAVVAACIENQADFLLLTGRCVDEGDFSLIGPTALRNGFTRLEEHDIPVYVACDIHELQRALRTGSHLPNSVTPISSASNKPAVFSRNGRPAVVFHSIQPETGGSDPIALETPFTEPPHSTTHDEPDFRIGLFMMDRAACVETVSTTGHHDESSDRWPDDEQFRQGFSRCDCDYLAISGEGPRSTFTLHGRMIHHPGPTQGQSHRQAGPHGCTLVEVDSSHSVHCQFIPSAPVRFERLTVKVHDETERGDLIQQMAAALRELRPEPTELVWLLQWTILGCGPLLNSLQQADTQREVMNQLDGNASGSEGPRRQHTFRVLQTEDTSGSDMRLAGDFRDRLRKLAGFTAETVEELLQWAELPDGPFASRLRLQMRELDPAAVESHVRSLGRSLVSHAAEDQSR